MSPAEDSNPVEPGLGREDQRSFDMGEDIAYQHREWTAQRIGWLVMALFVLAALLGLLGSMGPLASAYAEASDGSIGVNYMRLERHHAPARLVVEVSPESVVDGEVRLWMDADYLTSLGLQSIVPEPDSVELGAERITYVFTVSEGDGPMEITFQYEHHGFWRQEVQLGLVHGTSLEFSQFIFP
jgi:hypothetical protein